MFKAVSVSREVIGKGESLLLQGNSTTMDLSRWQEKVQCVYIDPPFMTGEQFMRRRPVGEEGWKKGTPSIQLPAYTDKFPSRESYLDFLRRLCDQAKMLLTPTGAFALHLDWRSAPYGRMICDNVFGEKNFMNEIVWAYESGGRSTKCFSRKHDSILLYARGKNVRFDITKVGVPRQDNRKNHMRRDVDENGRSYRSIRSGGKVYRYYDDDLVYPGDVWTDISHLQQKDPERTGFATQKPRKLLERILLPLTVEGDRVADLCCGSGTTMEAAQTVGCTFLGIDTSSEALQVTASRLRKHNYTVESECTVDEAVLDAEFDQDKGMVTLMGFHCPGEFPAILDPLAAVEQWRAGRIRDGVFYTDENLMRTHQSPDLPLWGLLSEQDGIPAVSLTDATGKRRVFQWEV